MVLHSINQLEVKNGGKAASIILYITGWQSKVHDQSYNLDTLFMSLTSYSTTIKLDYVIVHGIVSDFWSENVYLHCWLVWSYKCQFHVSLMIPNSNVALCYYNNSFYNGLICRFQLIECTWDLQHRGALFLSVNWLNLFLSHHIVPEPITFYPCSCKTSIWCCFRSAKVIGCNVILVQIKLIQPCFMGHLVLCID